MKIIYFDTETTGKDPEDRLIQLAFSAEQVNDQAETKETHLFNEFYKAALPVKVEAMAVHHITEEMLADKTAFAESSSYDEVRQLFEADDSYCIAHNIEFDQKMLAKEGIELTNAICTLKLSRYLDKEGKISSHGLQYLRYFLKLDVGDAPAHDALGDVKVLRALFYRLEAKFLELFPEDPYREMVRISAEPSLIPRFNFGKHRGLLIEEVAKKDRGYLDWLQNSEMQKGKEADRDMLFTLDYHLNPQARNKIPLSAL